MPAVPEKFLWPVPGDGSDEDWSGLDALATALPLTAARLEMQRGQGLIRNGVQLYVSLGGSPVADIGMGRARPGVAMTAATICTQYCTVKPFTAIAVAGLVSTGRLGLDQPVASFVPDFARHSKDRVTLRHVLTHTTGLRDRFPKEYAISPAQLLASICDARLELDWAPGAQAAYSQLFGWQLLGRVVEVVSGAPFSAYLREHVLAPLGLHDTWVGMPCKDYDRVHQRLGVSYISRETLPAHWSRFGLPDPDLTEYGEPVGPLWHELTQQSCAEVRPASGGYGPCRDLGRFYEALMAPGESPVAGIASPKVLVEFMSTQRSGMFDNVLGRVCDYGLGFMIDLRVHRFGDYCSARSYGHSGFQGASLAMADPEHGLVVALLCNDIVDWETAFLRRTAIHNAIYSDLGLKPGGDSGACATVPR